LNDSDVEYVRRRAMTFGLDGRKREAEWKGIGAAVDEAGSEDGTVNFGAWRNRRAAEDMLYKQEKEY
jgi:hypothetical protein